VSAFSVCVLFNQVIWPITLVTQSTIFASLTRFPAIQNSCWSRADFIGVAIPCSQHNRKGIHMMLFTSKQKKKLLSNGSEENRSKDHYPVVKLFLPGTACTWLLTELDPEDENRAFGLCDLGQGFPELGYVYIPELLQHESIFNVERDLHFEAEHPISVYARAARSVDAITEDPVRLKAAILKPQ
jgi:hypothetical protein